MTATQSGNGKITAKQRDVLNLLTRHMTTKEIARELAISPHTVYQRIRIAKRKLEASSRSDLIARYLDLRPDIEPIYGKPVYGDSDLPTQAIPLAKVSSNETEEALVRKAPMPINASAQPLDEIDIRLVPKLLAGRKGPWFRIATIGALAASLMIVGLAGLAMFAQLSEIFATLR